MRTRTAAAWRALLLVALLLAPLALSGHAHADETAGAARCATCIAAHRTPGLMPALASLPAPAVDSVAFVAAAPTAPVRVDRAHHAGRAPPPALPALVA
jgi:hypothetical protein